MERAQEQSVENSVDSGIIAGESTEERASVGFVGRIDVKTYKCVASDITTDEVVITDERVLHIKERHPTDFERFCSYMPEIIANPDYILEANRPNTAFLLKGFGEGVNRFQLILRLRVSTDPTDYKNSVITFLHISEKKWKKYLRNKKILYKRE